MAIGAKTEEKKREQGISSDRRKRYERIEKNVGQVIATVTGIFHPSVNHLIMFHTEKIPQVNSTPVYFQEFNFKNLPRLVK